ncbi:MAG TPA: hypothetical protein VNZ52_06440 [Candidatus Thermoplasmatota archaeon]|nr:hypothetical protein [Candidatus Thermoplasmatota archaeon]
MAPLDSEKAQRWQLLLLPLGGAVLGVVLGLMLSPIVKGEGFSSPSFWFGSATLLAIAGGVVLVRRARKATPKTSTVTEKEGTPHSREPETFQVEVQFPDIGERYPDLWGVGDPFTVRLQAPSANAGAPVTLIAWKDGKELFTREGLLGPEGQCVFTITLTDPATLHLEARVQAPGGLGRGGRVIRFNHYEDEIKATFGEFRAWALEKLGREDRPGVTAREIIAGLRAPPEAGKYLAEVLYVLEVLAYGERKAERGLYLHFLDCFIALEEARFFGSGGA